MKFLKTNIFTIVITFILLGSAATCGYSLWHYYLTVPNAPPNAPNVSSNNPGGNGGEHIGFLQHNNSSSEVGVGQNAPKNLGDYSSSQQNKFNINNSTTYTYSSLFTVYALAFFGMSATAFFLLMKKKFKMNIINAKLLMFLLLGTGLLLRISLALLFDGYPGDISLFKNWASSVSTNFSQFYSGSKSSDYPPLYIYILYLVGKIGSISFLNKFYILLLKLPSICADIITSYLIYKFAKKYICIEWSALISAFYIFNPAIFINSSLWGQVDSFFTIFIVGAIILLAEKKLYTSTIFFTAAILMKPQGIIFLPVLFFELVRQKNIKIFVLTACIAVFTVLIVILPFSYNKEFLWIFKLYSSTISEYPYASLNAYNFFSLIGANYAKNSSTMMFISYKTFGMLCIILTTLFSWYIYIKANSRKFVPAVALIQIVGVFTFSVGMHERYLFPAIALSSLTYIYLRDKRIVLIMLGLSITSYVNVQTILFNALNGTMVSTTYNTTIFVTSMLNVILFLWFVKVMSGISGTVKQQN